jgi:hypothetical protein
VPTAELDADAILEHLRPPPPEVDVDAETMLWAFELYCREFVRIVTKQGDLIPFALNRGQRALIRKLFTMRARGLPMRAVILKARQIGFSTLAQALVMWRTTLTANHRALVIAHDLDTGGMLFKIGRTIWLNLPDEPALPLKPPVSAFKRSRFMAFGASAANAWQSGDVGVDSEYNVSTATETESGRGGTFRSVHGSEVAMWPDIDGKTTAVSSAVPDDPDTLILWEGTAKGFNGFKDIWDDAEAGRSGYIPFFWPWWEHDEYSMEFMDAGERAEFRPGDVDQSPYAEREGELLDPGPVDYETGEHSPLSLEQLKWRRWAIANKCAGKIDKFNEEFPTVPEDAFLSTGSYVFEAIHVKRIQRTEVRPPDHQGALEATERPMRAGAHGAVEVPVAPKFTPVRNLMPGVDPAWKCWLDLEEDESTKELRPPKDGLYVIGVDVSGGVSEAEEGEPAFHAIEVIDHRTHEQVAEYSSRVDPHLFTEHVFLTAHFFNEAWLGIEITGGYGAPVARTIVQDWRYRFNYMRHIHDQRMDKEQAKVGWDTRPGTKPILLSRGAEIIKQEVSGIHSVELTREFLTYIRNDSGKTMPERGKFSDRLMAWLIAQQVATELPLRARKPKSDRPLGYQPKNPHTGY